MSSNINRCIIKVKKDLNISRIDFLEEVNVNIFFFFVQEGKPFVSLRKSCMDEIKIAE